MKKTLLILAAFIALAGCSSTPKNGMRDPNSKVFNCHFDESVEGKKVNFDFIPEDQSLVVGDTKITMDENDFTSGGFVYKSAKVERDWDVKLEFISYDKDPAVKITMSRSPYSKNPVFISKTCSK
jgi:uncharacterized protein YcfL